jgi:hypothetical protein
MATNLVIKANTTANDTTDSGNFVTLDLTNDKLIWSDGSAAVADGQDTPSDAELNEAAPLVPAGSAYEVPYLFLLDFSATGQELKLMDLAGSGNNRYVLRFEFDGPTATEPTLEAWDDNDHDSNDLECLGAGVGADSYISVIRTTAGSPGSGWTGTKISGDSNKSNMNGGAGALGSGSHTIYYNIRVEIPVGATPAAETPVLTIRYTWN